MKPGNDFGRAGLSPICGVCECVRGMRGHSGRRAAAYRMMKATASVSSWAATIRWWSKTRLDRGVTVSL
jgi:hypothetical protein